MNWLSGLPAVEHSEPPRNDMASDCLFFVDRGGTKFGIGVVLEERKRRPSAELAGRGGELNLLNLLTKGPARGGSDSMLERAVETGY